MLIEELRAGSQEKLSRELLTEQGLISVSGGIQIDINVVERTIGGIKCDGVLCDHNCTTKDGGDYNCPAAFTLNKGVKPRYASAEEIQTGILETQRGVRLANASMMASGVFGEYYDSFEIPEPVQQAIEGTIEDEVIEVNLFGGNPEMHPEVFQIAKGISSLPKTRVNLTTTGRIFLQKPDLISRLTGSGVSMLALSCDKIDPSLLKETENYSRNDFLSQWKTIRPLNGAEQKSLEALYTAHLLESYPDSSTRLLFNLVVHEGNIDSIYDIVTELGQQFPRALVNPYPAQSSIEWGEALFNDECLPKVDSFVSWMIGEHLMRNPSLTKRIHYWIMLKAALDTYRSDPAKAARVISGYDIWKCYKSPGSARYVQVGASRGPWPGVKISPGGSLACFWNGGVTKRGTELWGKTKAEEVSSYITADIQEIAKTQLRPCPGCIMPRLVFDLPSLEIGMSDEIKPAYLQLRKSVVGF